MRERNERSVKYYSKHVGAMVALQCPFLFFFFFDKQNLREEKSRCMIVMALFTFLVKHLNKPEHGR